MDIQQKIPIKLFTYSAIDFKDDFEEVCISSCVMGKKTQFLHRMKKKNILCCVEKMCVEKKEYSLAFNVRC